MNKFKPKKRLLDNDKVVISVRMDNSRIGEIDDIAGKFDISRNELIIQCVNYALDNIDFEYVSSVKSQKKKK